MLCVGIHVLLILIFFSGYVLALKEWVDTGQNSMRREYNLERGMRLNFPGCNKDCAVNIDLIYL